MHVFLPWRMEKTEFPIENLRLKDGYGLFFSGSECIDFFLSGLILFRAESRILVLFGQNFVYLNPDSDGGIEARPANLRSSGRIVADNVRSFPRPAGFEGGPFFAGRKGLPSFGRWRSSCGFVCFEGRINLTVYHDEKNMVGSTCFGLYDVLRYRVGVMRRRR